jgi:hypothetical protein
LACCTAAGRAHYLINQLVARGPIAKGVCAQLTIDVVNTISCFQSLGQQRKACFLILNVKLASEVTRRVKRLFVDTRKKVPWGSLVMILQRDQKTFQPSQRPKSYRQN